MRFQLMIFWLALMAARGHSGETLCFVSVDGEQRIASYRLDEMTGQLTKLADTHLAATPGPLCVSPDRRTLFASLRSSGQITSFRIAKNGKLSPLAVREAGADPAFLSTDRRGRFLLTAYYVASKVTVHKISPDGTIGAKPLQTIPTDEKAHGILPDPKNRFVFVPHTGPNAIYQFRFNEKTGRLTPNDPLFVRTGKNTGPRQFLFHPFRHVAFFDYEQGSAIASFGYDRNQGKLVFKQRLSTLPKGFQGENSNARIEGTPDGRFIYVANRGHDSLAGFEFDPETDKLTPISITSTEKTPRGFAIDPDGRYLVVAGQNSGKLAVHRINEDNGRLTRIGTYSIGKRPWWVLITRMP